MPKPECSARLYGLNRTSKQAILPSTAFAVAMACGLPSAEAQTTYFEDNFDCSSELNFGTSNAVNGWISTNPADTFRTDANGGVSPRTDSSIGSFGTPADSYENFLLTGHPTWRFVTVEATVVSTDDDGIGLVSNYADPDSYYACYWSNQQLMDCAGVIEAASAGSQTRLLKVDTNQACVDDYVVASSSVAVATSTVGYRMQLSVESAPQGNQVTCILDVDQDNTLGSAGDIVLSYLDTTPIAAGLAGLMTYDNGNADLMAPQVDAVLDDVVVTGRDLDTELDGLPDSVEIAVGTSTVQADSDGDCIGDRFEVGMPAFPLDTDIDGIIDALDSDSDDDGLPDILEVAVCSSTVAPPDSDCDGIYDFRDLGACDRFQEPFKRPT